jgi:hypothetical protein
VGTSRKSGLLDLTRICELVHISIDYSFKSLLMILYTRGGGNEKNLASSQFGPALRWMLYEALDHGLRMKLGRREWKRFRPHHSMTPFYKALEFLPLTRLSYDQSSALHETDSW